MTDLTQYYNRWQALDDLILEEIRRCSRPPRPLGREMNPSNEPPEPFERQPTILALLQSLREYAAGQFQFHYYGFTHAAADRLDSDPVLQTWDRFPPEDVLTGILDQIGHDFALIQRAAEQRRSPNKSVRAALAMADRLAWLALEPAIKHKIITAPVTVLTYFEKSAQFYSIPYASVALISVPFTCSSPQNKMDFLAIPHEVGHYVYRHLTDEAVAMLRGITEAPEVSPIYRDWITNVFEEMCADIYGCLIAGPIMALDFQYLALANSEARFAEGDNTHPNAALRPLIYCLVLANPMTRRLTRDNWGPIAEKLAARWDDQLGRRHVDSFPITPNRAEGQTSFPDRQTRKISDLRPLPRSGSASDYGPLGNAVNHLVNQLILIILDYVKRTEGLESTNDLDGWALHIDIDTTLNELLDQYDAWFKDARARDDRVPELDPSGEAPRRRDPTLHTSELWLRWAEPTNPGIDFRRAGNPIPSGAVEDTTQMRPNTWGYILNAKGWTTDGPSDDWRHPLT